MEMVLQGKWRELYTELLTWHNYCKDNDLWPKQVKSSDDIKAFRAQTLADKGKFRRAVKAVDSTGIAQATGPQIHDIHPEGDSMTNEDRNQAQERYDEDDTKWPRERTLKMAHSIYYLIRDLDQESAASISGLRYSDITPIARQINAID